MGSKIMEDPVVNLTAIEETKQTHKTNYEEPDDVHENGKLI